MKTLLALRIAVSFGCACFFFSAHAQDLASQEAEPRQLTVMTSGTFAPALARLAPRFEHETGATLTIVRGASLGSSPTSIPSRLAANETADVIILSRGALDQLIDQGLVRQETTIDLVRSRIAMAVRAGSARPDISTVDAFVDAVRQASSFAYSSSVSGSYLSTRVFPELGIWDEVESKGIRVSGEPVAEVVARGDAELGFQQVSEILAVTGVELVGPLPEEIQLVSTFSAAVTERSIDPAAAEALIAFLSSKSAADTIAAMGLEPVASESTR